MRWISIFGKLAGGLEDDVSLWGRNGMGFGVVVGILNARQTCCAVGYDWMGWIVRLLLVAFNIGKFAAGLNGAVSLQ